MFWNGLEWVWNLRIKELLLYRGRVQFVEPFCVNEYTISGMQNKPLLTFCLDFDSSINDHQAKSLILKKYIDYFSKLDKSFLTEFMMVWASQQIILKQIEWDFLIYELSLTHRNGPETEQISEKMVRIAQSLTDISLYSNQGPSSIPFKSFFFFKKAKFKGFLQLKYSSDRQVSTARQHSTGYKWNTLKAIKHAAFRQKCQFLVGFSFF